MVSCSGLKSKSAQFFSKQKFYGKHIPLDGLLELTHKCNFQCVHCYGRDERAVEDLCYEQWVDIFRQLVVSGCLSVIFTGGEVLCRSDFAELYVQARKMGLMVAVFSNASLLTESMTRLFYEYPLSYFSTTMYGFSPETYKAVTGNAENYRKFMNGLSLLEKYEIPIELKAVAIRENYHDIKDIHDFAMERGYPFRCSTNIRNTNAGDSFPTGHALSAEEAFQLDLMFPERLAFWKGVAQNPEPQPYTDMRRRNQFKYLCHIGEQSFAIDAQGMIHACAVDRVHGFSLLEYSFDECWNKWLPAVASEKAPPNFKCMTCPDFRYCEQCSASIELEAGVAMCLKDERCRLAELRHNWCDSFKND